MVGQSRFRTVVVGCFKLIGGYLLGYLTICITALVWLGLVLTHNVYFVAWKGSFVSLVATIALIALWGALRLRRRSRALAVGFALYFLIDGILAMMTVRPYQYDVMLRDSSWIPFKEREGIEMFIWTPRPPEFAYKSTR